MEPLQLEIERRWRVMFDALAAGEDVSPSRRLRTEGMMEAAVLSGVASAEALNVAMNAIYSQSFGQDIAADFGEDWQDFFPFPQIPAMGRRAPVYPSTSD